MTFPRGLLELLVLCLCSWLLRDGGMRLRTTHPGFTQAVEAFFDKLIPKVVPLQVTPVHRQTDTFSRGSGSRRASRLKRDALFVFQFKKGGPIIAVQVENGYGSFAKDGSYMLFIKEVS